MKKIGLGVLYMIGHLAYANSTLYDQQYLKWKADQSTYVKQRPQSLMPTVGQTQGKISINYADIKKLQQLQGVGEKKAQVIIEYRKTHGPFKHVSELKNVSGIGEKTFEKNKAILAL